MTKLIAFLKSERARHLAAFVAATVGAVYDVWVHGHPITIGILTTALYAQWAKMKAQPQVDASPPSVPPAAVFALLFALPLSSCAHVTPVWNGIVHCAEQATHEASLGILDDVESALACDVGAGAAGLPACALAALEDLGKRFTQGAVACAVQEIAHRSSVKAQQVGDKFEELKAERARVWLAKNSVVFE